MYMYEEIIKLALKVFYSSLLDFVFLSWRKEEKEFERPAKPQSNTQDVAWPNPKGNSTHAQSSIL